MTLTLTCTDPQQKYDKYCPAKHHCGSVGLLAKVRLCIELTAGQYLPDHVHIATVRAPLDVYCLSSALHCSIGQNIKLLAESGVQYPVSVLRPECEELQMAITEQRVIRSTSCLVLDCFLARIALFNLNAHELHELYYNRPTA